MMQASRKIIFLDTWKNFLTLGKNFVFKDWKALIFFHYLGKIAGLRPAISVELLEIKIIRS